MNKPILITVLRVKSSFCQGLKVYVVTFSSLMYSYGMPTFSSIMLW